MIYLLDTNILLAYMRRGALYQKIEAIYRLIAGTDLLIVSVVNEGELRVLAEEFSWGASRRRGMEDVLALTQVYPLPYGNVIDKYVEISEFSRKMGRAMGKNDLWIAATAAATGATLLTTDRDFDHLDPALLTHHWVDPTV